MHRRPEPRDATSPAADRIGEFAPGTPALGTPMSVSAPLGDDRLPEITLTPADDVLRTLVRSRLLRMGRRLAGRISVCVIQGAVILRGSVDTLQEKRLVLDAVRQIGPVQTLRDQISVVVAGESTPLRRRSPSAGGWQWLGVGLAVLGGLVLIGVQWGPRPRGVETVNVLGLVEVQGTPAEGAFLALHPVERSRPESPLPRGQVGPGGTVEWSTFTRGDGLPAGDYVVVAAWHRMVCTGDEVCPGPNLLSPIYRSPETSPLRIRVTSESAAEPLHLRLE